MKLNQKDRDLAMQFLGVRGEIPENITELFDKYEPVLQKVIAPHCVYEVFEYDVGANLVFARNGRMRGGQTQGPPLQGEDIKKHLQGCNKIILFAATLGLQTDELIRQTEACDMAGAVVSDAIASAVIERFCDDVGADLVSARDEQGRKQGSPLLTARFSPGYGDFPLEVQSELLKILNAKKKIGLYVNENNLLIPRKSVTAVIGIVGNGS